MSEYHALFPVQQKDDNWAEEFPLQVDPNTPPSRYTSGNVFPRREAENMTDQLRSSAVRKPLRSSRLQSAAVQISDPGTDSLAAATKRRSSEPSPSAAQARQLSTISSPSYDSPATQSLVATLQ